MELDDNMTVNQDEIYTDKFGKDWERISIAEKSDPEQDETMICDETVPYYVSDHSNSHDEVTFISGRRSTALINEDSDGTDEDMYDRYHLANSRDELMETLLVPSSNYSLSVAEICDSDESETSSIVSSFDEVDVSDDDDELIASVERVRKSSTTTHISTQKSIRKDDRPFAQFMEEEGLIEVTRDWKKYPTGSSVVIKADGALWIANEKTHVVISKATQDIMKKEGLWGKGFFIGTNRYVVAGTDFKSLHLKIASSKKHSDFHDLLLSGWKGKKDELEILHLNDCSYDFNIENLSWNTHAVNLLLKLSKGSKHGTKYRCSTNINGKIEKCNSCDILLEARHAVDILKFHHVDHINRQLVFNHGLNFKYPSVEALLSRTHLYKSKPTHQGKPFKSTGIITILEWKYADVGLIKAVEESKIPFDSTLDVLVKYNGQKGKGVTLMFVMELSCYNQHILNQEVTFKLSRGWVNIDKDNYTNIGLHRLILGLKTGDFKVGRHRVNGNDGKRGNLLANHKIIVKGCLEMVIIPVI
jgi:hypothetical protein